MIMYNLFPVAVSKFELGRDLYKKELDFINKQELYKNEGNNTSLDRYVLKSKMLSNLNQFFESSLAQYFSEVFAPKENVTLRITQSWINYTRKHEFHHKHTHPNSLVSGVFYVKANKQKDKIHFFNDRNTILDVTTDNYNVYNSKSWWLEAQTGYLYLFPSTLPHMVEPIEEDLRISLSFNTFPVGYIGEEKSLTALYL